MKFTGIFDCECVEKCLLLFEGLNIIFDDKSKML